MTRVSKVLALLVLLVFVLACSFVTQPIKDVQNIAGTAESLATSLPIETLQALPSAIPVETLQALPSSIPELENFNYFNPQGEPVPVWKDIPIMSEATVGQEYENSTYSFKVDATPQEIQEYYDSQLTDLGWKSVFNLPIESEGGLLSYSKGDSFLTVTIARTDNLFVVVLTLV